MSQKSDTFNIDDLLSMPNMANNFTHTGRFDDENNEPTEFIHDEEISIDTLLNESMGIAETPVETAPETNNIYNKEEESPVVATKNFDHVDIDNISFDIPDFEETTVEEEKKCVVPPPPPPPIPSIPNKIEDFHFEEIEELSKTPVQPTFTNNVNLEDFELKFDNDDEIKFNNLEEDIETVINLETQNDYYKNIVDEQDIKNDSQYTRIYFDEEDIENRLNEIKPEVTTINETPVEAVDATSLEEATPINVNEPIKEAKVKEPSKRTQNKLFHKEHFSTVPSFYRFEYYYANTNWWISIALVLTTILTFSLSSYAIFGLGYNEWLYLPNTLFGLGTISYFILSTIKKRSMIKELRTYGYIFTKDDALPSINRVYKQLITSNYYLNWGAASLYVVSGLLILLTFIVTYFINVFDHGGKFSTFGDLVIHYWVTPGSGAAAIDNNAAYIVVWTFASICFLMAFLQMLFNPLNIYRRNQIEVFYGKTLISEEMIEKYRKSANRKGLIMFIASTIVVSFVVLITWLVLRRKAKAKAA